MKVHQALQAIGYGVLPDRLDDPPRFRLVVAGTHARVERQIWEPVVRACLGLVAARHESVRLAHGAAVCVDSWADATGHHLGWDVKRYEADWAHLSRAAGPIRNGFMLRSERPDLVLGFLCRASSPGTVNCLVQARRLGLRTVTVTGEDLLVWDDVRSPIAV